MFGSYGEAHRAGENFLFFFFLVGKLRMGSRSWVNDQRFHVGDIGEQRKDFQIVDETMGFFCTPFYLESENRTGSLWEIPFVQCMVGVVGQSRVVYPFYFRVSGQKVHYFQGVFYMTFHAQGEGLQSL